MSTLPEVLHHSDLIHLLVIDRASLDELGRVEVVWMYIPAHKVLGFVCKTGFLGGRKLAFNLSQIHSYGDKRLLMGSSPQETDAERVSQLESLIGSDVWSDAGEKLGKITDYRFSPRTGDISDYLFTTGPLSALTDGVYRLPPYRILSVGRQKVVIAATSVQSLSLHREGIKQKLKKVEDTLRQDYTQATQELRSLTQRAQSATELAKERARLLAEQVAEQAKGTVQLLNEQLKEGSQTLAEKSQELAEQVKEQAVALREQLAEPLDLPDPSEPNLASNRKDSIAKPADKPAIDVDLSLIDEWDIETPPASPTEPQLSAPTARAAAGDDADWADEPRPNTGPNTGPNRGLNVDLDQEPPARSAPTAAPTAAPAALANLPTQPAGNVPDSSQDDEFWDDLWDAPPAAPPAAPPPAAPREPLPGPTPNRTAEEDAWI